ncbi:hypothetical protein SAMN05421736_1074 [Evansella caseinilytica]|uniref:Uncharacterized protein n=1 Tax=Evansella caseinilytica TaxID=1503961 RepID=A0A1H3QRC3_9BACI|nr:hypothetical protein [Evansella caseinilytica]SDZ15631.1 hypothetical protein SAMN05421736_1074 [Evansella caseinilytica]
MSYCPVCNGLQRMELVCPSCQHPMYDQGRQMDYFDDYSAYLPIELTKENDDIADDKRLKKCPHLMICDHCNMNKIILIQEMD